MKLEKTIVVAALYCCGKTYLSQHSDYSVLDLDGELKKDKDKSIIDYHTKYIRTLKESIGKYDIILVYPATGLLFDLNKMNIPYVLVYPKNCKSCEEEWERRNNERGTSTMWSTLKPYHKNKVRSLSMNKKAKKKYELDKAIKDYVKSGRL